MREVEYIADKDGFRAVIKTNEPGTAPKDPAYVKMNAQPIQVDYYPQKQQNYDKKASQGEYQQTSQGYGQQAQGGDQYGLTNNYAAGNTYKQTNTKYNEGAAYGGQAKPMEGNENEYASSSKTNAKAQPLAKYQDKKK